MRPSLVLAGLVVVSLATATPGWTCGDKFLVVGRGVRYKQVTAADRGTQQGKDTKAPADSKASPERAKSKASKPKRP